MSRRPDKYERFMTGYMTARRLCQEIGFKDMANPLANVFCCLQSVHQDIVYREAKKLTLNVIRSYQEGKIGKGKTITDAQVASVLGLSRKKVRVLDNLRSTPPPDALDQIKELVRVTKDLRLPGEKLSALLVAGALGLTVKQMAGCLDRSVQALKKKPDADSLQERLADFERVARLRAVVTADGCTSLKPGTNRRKQCTAFAGKSRWCKSRRKIGA